MWQETHETWEEPVPEIKSTFMCRYTCLFLQTIIKEELGLDTQIVSGRPEKELNATRDGLYGFKDSYGRWHDHSWLVCNNKIIDLTADQFGGEEIIYVDMWDSRYRPNSDQSYTAFNPKKLKQTSNDWIDLFYSSNVCSLWKGCKLNKKLDRFLRW